MNTTTSAPLKDLPSTVGEAKAHPDFEKHDRFSPHHAHLREHYEVEAPLFFLREGGSRFHMIAFIATADAEGAPLRRIQ